MSKEAATLTNRRQKECFLCDYRHFAIVQRYAGAWTPLRPPLCPCASRGWINLLVTLQRGLRPPLEIIAKNTVFYKSAKVFPPPILPTFHKKIQFCRFFFL